MQLLQVYQLSYHRRYMMKRIFVKAASTEKMLSMFKNRIDELSDSDDSLVTGATSADMIDEFTDEIDSIYSSRNIWGSEKLDIADEDHNVLYLDESCMFGNDPHEILSLADIKQYWNNEADNDPAIQDEYKPNEGQNWVNDTLSFLKPVDYSYADEYVDSGAADRDVMSSDEGIVDEGLESIEGKDHYGDDDVYMLMDYIPGSPEDGIDADRFELWGKFFADSEDAADAELEQAKQNNERKDFIANMYITPYNSYFDDGEEVYPDLTTLIDLTIRTPQEIEDDEYLDDLPFASTDIEASSEDGNMYDAAFSFDVDEAKMDEVYDEIWSLQDDNPEIDEAIKKFDADHHGEYEPLRFVLEVMYGLDQEDYVGVPPFTVYIKDRGIHPDTSDMVHDLAVKGSLEIYDTDDVEGCDSVITGADEAFEDDDEEYDPEFDSTEDDWEQLDQKSVRDSDGFLTDYTLYRNTETGLYVCIFGDSDLYRPEDGYFDFETDNYDEAIDWFNTYSLDDED